MAALTTGSVGADATASHLSCMIKANAYVQKRLASSGDPTALHDRVALLWAKSAQAELITDVQAQAITDAIAATQLEDGGLSFGAWLHGALASARGQF